MTGTFGNNFGNNWAYAYDEAQPVGGHQQQVFYPQPFVTHFLNSVQIATAQSVYHNIKCNCCSETFNSIKFQLSMIRIGNVSNPTIGYLHNGRLSFLGITLKYNTLKMSLSTQRQNSIFIVTDFSDFIKAKFDKVKKLKTVVKLLDLLDIGTSAETTRVVYRIEFDHEKEDECDDYADEEYDISDPDIPILPIHPNCKCYWEDADTGEVLGQDLGDLGTNLSTDF